MMRTIRQHVFETNSSSEHSITFSKELRSPEDFPKLDADGILKVEVKHYWTCGGAGTCTSDVKDIIEYLCTLAVHCASKFPDSMTQVLNDIKYAYANMALPTPKGIEVYVVDDKGIRHPYHQLVNEEVDYVVMDEDMNYECCFRSLNNYYETMRPSEFKEFCRLHQGYIDEKVVVISRQVGLACNLIWDDYKRSTEDMYSTDIGDENSYDGKDLLVNKSTLSFFHT